MHQGMEWTKSWDMLKNYMFRNDIEHYLWQWYDSNIYGCRNSLVSRDAEIPRDMMPCSPDEWAESSALLKASVVPVPEAVNLISW